VFLLAHAGRLFAQTASYRGFADGSVFAYPQEASNDTTQVVGDLLVRNEVFAKPAAWLQFAAGLDFRANSHDQVADSWRVDFWDRGLQRPRLSIRRLTATMTHGPYTLDVGKQFIRWGKTDIVTPTDHFAPRDFLNVVDNDFLAVTAVRGSAQLGQHTFDVVWAPRFTPSRTPLLTQRWAVIPAEVATLPIVENATGFPDGSQAGVRWGHMTGSLEYSLSFFNGFNHLPDFHAAALLAPSSLPTTIEVSRDYPPLRSYGGDLALPIRWLTIKAESAYFTSSSPTTDEYVLYVVQLERQSGEWVFVGGYAGEAVTRKRSLLTFAPDRGLSRAIVARAAYTIDSNRNVAFEGAVKQNGDGMYVKGEYSQARGQHWRATVTGVVIAGEADDFLGQYSRNSHLLVSLRYSF
jgi:hypothetical protein